MDKIKDVLRDLWEVFRVLIIFSIVGIFLIAVSLGVVDFMEPSHECEIISDEPITPHLIIKVLREGNDTTYIYRK